MNAIPFEAWAEVDMRSASPAALKALDAKFHKAIDAAVAEKTRDGAVVSSQSTNNWWAIARQEGPLQNHRSCLRRCR